VKSACFPAGCCVAATFDVDIARKLGSALAEEARHKGAQCMLGPTVGIHRHPLGGRNFESFSEDPFLTGKVSSGFIRGLQNLGVSATLKHFVANEQETERTTVDETVSERALREIYLRPFEIAVQEAKPWAMMTGYNIVNGVHCDSSKWLLRDILRDEWGYKGLVMSDWGGTNSVAAGLEAGLDLEMPGPPRMRKPAAILDALKKGLISEDIIDERVRTVLEWVYKLKAFQDAALPATVGDRPEHRALIREAGAKGMVLLKNQDGVLPLTKEKVKGKTIALIGFAKDAFAHGGGSASVNSYYTVTPWDGLHSALGDSVKFTFAKGAHKERLLPSLDKRNTAPGTVVGLDGQPGFTRNFYNPGESTPSSVTHSWTCSYFTPFNNDESVWKVLEIVGDFTPAESGDHYMACSGLGPSRVWVDDDLIFEQKGNCSDPMGFMFLAAAEKEIRRPFVAGKSYRIRIVSDPPVNISLSQLEGKSGVRFGFSLASEHDADLEGEAIEVAKDADIAIVFAGHDSQWETEGRDQDSFDLPRGQNSLISAVTSVNKNTIVVNSTGVAVSMPWLNDVKGLVQAWFAGQECGNAVADVLTGVINPEGNLPVTFPVHIEDSPAYGNFPGNYVNGQLKVKYAEDVFVGYRHFDKAATKVNFPFGFGMSYTSFDLGKMQVRRKTDETFAVDVTARNTGKLAGGVLVQLYVGNRNISPLHPNKILVGFQKVRLQPGEEQVVTLPVSARDFAHFDVPTSSWVVEEGEYTFSLARSVTDVLSTVDVKVGSHRYSTIPKWSKPPGSDSPLLPPTKESYAVETKERNGPAYSRRLALLPLLLTIPLFVHLFQGGQGRASDARGLADLDIEKVISQLEVGLGMDQESDLDLALGVEGGETEEHSVSSQLVELIQGGRKMAWGTRRQG
jgi:beta-glucosidase